MRLDEVIPSAPAAAGAVDITDLAYDNRRVTPGTLFFCVPGMTRDGHEFAPDAIERGAVAIVVQRPLGLGVPEVPVDDVRAAMAPAAARFNGDPSASLRVVGITGTNGKTTTAFLIRELLEGAGRQAGLLGTVKSVIGGVQHDVQRTTPEAIDLQRDFAAMLAGDDVACAIEVSSHALELHRADAIHFAAAVFTNLTQDHLDFHPTMEEYFLAKRRLFDGRAAVSIVNVDDPYGARLAAELERPVTYAIDRDADYRAADVDTGLDGTHCRVNTPDGEKVLSSPLRGRFNIYNVLGALAAVRALGVPLDMAIEGIKGAGRVPGRFEPVDEGQPFAVLVDYAHTPDSLENVLQAARGLTTDGRLHVVFGCGGDRDRAKRPMMGQIARRLADRVIVTSDNPRSEDPEAIIEEILIGSGSDVEQDADRREAIALAIGTAEPGDVVVIAGKGHEQGQEFADGQKIPFDDVTVAREGAPGRPAMRAWSPEQIARAAGAELSAGPTAGAGPERAVIDSRAAGPGTLFVGLGGERVHGGSFAPGALDSGAWGVLTDFEQARAAAEGANASAVVLGAEDPLLALQRLATAWRRDLGAAVIGVTGSTGKTSTKDILLALLAPHRATVASRENYNTEIGLPLEILNAPAGTEVLVLEMAMRGAGQIAELAAIAEPGVGVIVSIGPVHLELLGSIEAIAAAKAELLAGLPAGGTAVIPADEELLAPYLRGDLELVTFGGDGADVQLAREDGETVAIDARGVAVTLEVPFTQAHLRRNLLAAVAAAQAVGVTPAGRVELALSSGRGQRAVLASGVTLIDDCYNANPMSMSAALDELQAREPDGSRRVAVLGDMLELGPAEREYHSELGDRVTAAHVDVLVTVGPLAAAIADRFDGESYIVADAGEAAALMGEVIGPGDVVLVKGSRGVGLELVCDALRAET